MNGAHVHLIFNHIPVILAPAGLVILALGRLRQNAEFVKAGLGVIVAAALFTVPTFLSGEPAEDVVGSLPGVSMSAIDRHADVATQAFAVVVLAGVAALALLVRAARGKSLQRWLVATTLVLALIASVWLGVTANLGGQIRHAEIGVSATSER